jgi:hypothetical protein
MKTLKKITILCSFLLVCTLVFPQLKVISSGNVGIGQNNPVSKLEVFSNNPTDVKIYAIGGSGYQARLWTCNDIFSYGFGIGSDNKGHIYKNINSPSPIITFDSEGNIRGNQSEGSTRFQTDYGYITIGPLNSYFAHFYTNIDYYYFNQEILVGGNYIGSYNSDLTLGIYKSPYMRIKYSNGYVGIGHSPVSEPQYRLDVFGTVRADNISPSDSSLKTNISNIPINRISDIYSIVGKTYQKKQPEFLKQETPLYDTTIESHADEYDDRFHFGFIAQDILKIYPELVYEDSKGILSLSYDGFIPMIIEALKEQRLTIDSLRNELNILKSIDNFKSDLDNSLNTDTEINSCYLYQNNPNPFNLDSEIRMRIPELIQNAMLYIFDMNGTQIKSFALNERGLASVTIYGSELNPGMYLYTLIVDGFEVSTKRMILTE